MQHKIFLCFVFFLFSCSSIEHPPVSVEQRQEFVQYADGDNRVYFKFGSAKIEDEGVVRINDMIDKISIVNDVKVLLYGYTDRVGKKAYNKKLATRRVNAIKKALKDSGVIDKNNITIETVAFGEYDPLVSFDTADNNPQSRRVDMFIVKKEK